ncbi:hypothetical protein SSX86_006199 [Deinandra increscens subsp. villosa]|uniref:Uncharacterized protein n=1 Tax=Deinandra increscens subsp. villosa TaxID=3103831 RepID=A0AAP0DML7_9ASTR
MAISTSASRVILPSQCRSDPAFSGATPRPNGARFSPKLGHASVKRPFGTSSLILRFPPNFVRQLSNKAQRNCSNIGVAQIVAASWSNNQPLSSAAEGKAAASSAVSVSVGEDVVNSSKNSLGCCNGSDSIQFEDMENVRKPSFLSGDGSLAIHAATDHRF